MTIDAVALHKLLAWTSPGYPTGAFSYSHGLEQAVEDGLITDVGGLVAYVEASLTRGCAFIDAVVFASAWRAAGDPEELVRIAEEASAWRATSELALESRQQGAAFLAVTRKAWPHPMLEAFVTAQSGRPTPHAVAVAVSCASHHIALASSLEAYLHGFCANLVSAGVRLIPLGQTNGQLALARLAPIASRAAEAAVTADLNEIGTSTAMLDIVAMRHETQYTRLFRS